MSRADRQTHEISSMLRQRRTVDQDGHLRADDGDAVVRRRILDVICERKRFRLSMVLIDYQGRLLRKVHWEERKAERVRKYVETKLKHWSKNQLYTTRRKFCNLPCHENHGQQALNSVFSWWNRDAVPVLAFLSMVVGSGGVPQNDDVPAPVGRLRQPLRHGRPGEDGRRSICRK